MNRFVRLVTLLAIVLAAGLGSGAQVLGQDAVNRSDLRFVVVSHGQASDPFWSVVQNGVNQAAKDMGVQVEYQAPATFDMVAMSQLIDAAVASQPDGMAISIPDADALGESIQAGVDAGVTTALCVNQEVGNVALDDRCRGFTDGLAESGGTVEVVQVNLNDPTEAQARIEAALSTNPDVDGILALGPTGAAPALEALRGSGQLGTIQLATFDLSPDVLEAIQSGDMLFAIDSQQYMQGYLPIVLLTLHATNLNTIANPVLMTGPGFVTKENAAEVIDLAAAGTR